MALDEMRVPLAYQPTTTTGVGAARTAAAPETVRQDSCIHRASPGTRTRAYVFLVLQVL
jgi:hypothetical protein